MASKRNRNTNRASRSPMDTSSFIANSLCKKLDTKGKSFSWEVDGHLSIVSFLEKTACDKDGNPVGMWDLAEGDMLELLGFDLKTREINDKKLSLDTQLFRNSGYIRLWKAEVHSVFAKYKKGWDTEKDNITLADMATSPTSVDDFLKLGATLEELESPDWDASKYGHCEWEHLEFEVEPSEPTALVTGVGIDSVLDILHNVVTKDVVDRVENRGQLLIFQKVTVTSRD